MAVPLLLVLLVVLLVVFFGSTSGFSDAWWFYSWLWPAKKKTAVTPSYEEFPCLDMMERQELNPLPEVATTSQARMVEITTREHMDRKKNLADDREQEAKH